MKKLIPAVLLGLLFGLSSLSCSDDDDDGSGNDWPCAGETCVNADGNTHTDCQGSCDFCNPDISGADMLGIPALSCTKKNCVNADDCPDGYSCMTVPSFVVDMALDDYGINLPASVCGKQ